jgi:hypothetical protein
MRTSRKRSLGGRPVLAHRAFGKFGLPVCLMLLGCQDADSKIPIDSMIVYSLDGKYEPRQGKKPTEEVFHDYPVLGKVDIASPKDRTAILVAVKKGIANSDGEEMKCFWPRHGVRLTQGGKTIEYLICFECRQLNEFVDGRTYHKLTTRSPAAVLDEQLERGGVPKQKPNFED